MSEKRRRRRGYGAYALVRGGDEYPDINGTVAFRQLRNGVLVTAEINGLPKGHSGMGVFAFHIHSGGRCSGNSEDEFANALTHYNPDKVKHPYHAGDLPPLFGNNGFAYMEVFTDRFTVNEIIGKTVIIHSGTDDFKSQPAGNSGKKIACGVIVQG